MTVPLGAALLALLATGGAAAGELPGSSLSDHRVRTVVYDPARVVSLTGHYGYQTFVAFALDERIQNISIGDSIAWAVTPNKVANGLFIKPVEPNAATNMTVQTTARTYLFDLSAARPSRGGQTPAMTYKLQFSYPEPERRQSIPAAPPPPPAYNSDYRISGARRLRPTYVFDDGRQTLFAWPSHLPIPAVFALDDKREALVNHQMRGGYLVVDRIAEAFVLRHGKTRALVANKAFGKAAVPAVRPAPAVPASGQETRR